VPCIHFTHTIGTAPQQAFNFTALLTNKFVVGLRRAATLQRLNIDVRTKDPTDDFASALAT
jgi:hypothetical protein